MQEIYLFIYFFFLSKYPEKLEMFFQHMHSSSAKNASHLQGA